MKKRIFNLILFTVCGILTAVGQTQEETRTVLYPKLSTDSIFLITPDTPYEGTITFEEQDYPQRRFLRVIGGTKMPGKFAPRGETLFREFEYLIDDCLDSLNTKRDRYSLYFNGGNDSYERHAYYRLTDSVLQSGDLTVEIDAKRNNLKIDTSGDFGLELQVYFKKEGRHADEVYDAPDSVLYMPIEKGTNDFATLKSTFALPTNIAAILVRVGGTKFSGECWLEAPRFYQGGKLISHIPFVKHEDRDSDYNYWVGVNMVSRNWPLWRVELDGKVLFRGYKFDRASDIADFYIKLPNDLNGKGELKVFLEKEPHKARLPYELKGLELIEESARDFEIVSVPKYIAVGDTTGILIEVNKPDISLDISSAKGIEPLNKTYEFSTTGLHTIQAVATSPAVDIPLTISQGDDLRNVVIEQTIEKERDNVYISSGDEIHIDKEYEPYDYFFKWYIKERVGNWYQFRPSYQWSGVRITSEEFTKHYTKLLTEMHMPYAWQVEGRTLAATRINPSLDALKSPMFRGKQAHENDGGYYYWQHFTYGGLFSDMAARTRPYGGIFAKHRPIYTDKGVFIHYDPHAVKDMAHGATTLVNNFRYSKGESTRHTGPSTMFRYLYQAGYEWLGAEQMYGPEDIIMSSLRGASRAYGKKNYGSLHAMQWGSRPFTDTKHSLRLYLSLAVAYIHGSSHINTEEALWVDEYANDRYSKSGKEHMHAQHQLYDYIQTHTRGGEMHTPIAVMQGRNDAWKSFVRGPVWSQEGNKWKFNEALESFDLLRVFYPDNIVDASGPDGWFTTTPYGAVDILPIEAKQDVLAQYKVLMFLGWNTYDASDFVRIRDFIKNGGTVLMTAAHLNAELQPDLPTEFPSDDRLIKEVLGDNYKNYAQVVDRAFGKGRVIYFPKSVYPINESIRDRYTEYMKSLAIKSNEKESVKGWIKSSPHIDFTVWDSADRRTIYMLNTDWRDEEAIHPATLSLNNRVFSLDVDKYIIATVHCSLSLGMYPLANTTDVLSITENKKEWIVKLQTTGADTVYFFNGLTGKQQSQSISEAGIHTIKIKKK